MAPIAPDDGIEPQAILTPLTESALPLVRSEHAEFGTCFIGSSRTPEVTEQDADQHVCPKPPDNYDSVLDFSHGVTGSR